MFKVCLRGKGRLKDLHKYKSVFSVKEEETEELFKRFNLNSVSVEHSAVNFLVTLVSHTHTHTLPRCPEKQPGEKKRGWK